MRCVFSASIPKDTFSRLYLYGTKIIIVSVNTSQNFHTKKPSPRSVCRNNNCSSTNNETSKCEAEITAMLCVFCLLKLAI
jgi:hypothetical protein